MDVSSLLFQLFYTQAYIIERDTYSYGTKKTPPLILYIKASTVDDEYCLMQFHQVISSADKKPRARYSTKDEH